LLATSNQQLATHRGFTFVELMMGLVITSMIMVAVTAIMTSVARGWNDQRVTQSTQLQANQVYARVQRILSAAKYVVSPANNHSSSSDILFWANDYNADGAVEAGELGLIELDTTTNTLYYYSSSSQTGAASTQMSWSTLQSLTAAQLKGWSYMQKTALGGPGNSGNANALQVTGAQFYVTGLSSTTQLPIVEFTLGFKKNGQYVTLYNCTTMRSPTTQPN